MRRLLVWWERELKTFFVIVGAGRHDKTWRSAAGQGKVSGYGEPEKERVGWRLELKKGCVRDVLGSVYVVLPCKGEQPRLGNEAKSGLFTQPIQVHAALSSQPR